MRIEKGIRKREGKCGYANRKGHKEEANAVAKKRGANIT